MAKIKPRRGNIPDFEQPEPQTVQFSFKHIECDHARYPLTICKVEFWQDFVRELKKYSSMHIDSFCEQKNLDVRHMVDPDDTKESSALEGLAKQLGEDSDVWQFGIGHKGCGHRAFGILVGSMFYLLWLDTGHDVYKPHPKKRL